MNTQCSKCGLQLEEGWVFCPTCGITSVTKHEPHLSDVPHENAPVPSIFGGALIGVIAVPLLLIPGALLCFTGIGAVLGIPMILGAIAAPMLGVTVGTTKFKGSTLQSGSKSVL